MVLRKRSLRMGRYCRLSTWGYQNISKCILLTCQGFMSKFLAALETIKKIVQKEGAHTPLPTDERLTVKVYIKNM